MTVVALHPEDIVAIAGVILAWVALRKLSGRRRRSSAEDTPTSLDDDG